MELRRRQSAATNSKIQNTDAARLQSESRREKEAGFECFRWRETRIHWV